MLATFRKIPISRRLTEVVTGLGLFILPHLGIVQPNCAEYPRQGLHVERNTSHVWKLIGEWFIALLFLAAVLKM